MLLKGSNTDLLGLPPCGGDSIRSADQLPVRRVLTPGEPAARAVASATPTPKRVGDLVIRQFGSAAERPEPQRGNHILCPSWPAKLLPQQYAFPAGVRPQVWAPPALTAAKVTSVDTFAGEPLHRVKVAKPL